MSDSSPNRLAPSASRDVPAAVREVAQRLAAAGHEVWITGECLYTLCVGKRPEAYELSTSAGLAEILSRFPSAVPTDAARGVATVPAPGAGVDVVPFQRGTSPEDDLAARDFTIFAMAWAPSTEELLDPYGGHADVARGVLRCVGDAEANLARDPIRALRAVRLAAMHGCEPDAELERAMRATGPSMHSLPPFRARSELSRTLLAERPSRGLRLLRRTGLETRLFRRVRADAAELVDRMPPVLHVRMAAWLRGVRPARTLRNLRFGIDRSRRIEYMLAYHPLDEVVAPNNDRSIARLMRHLPDDDLRALFEMRAFELERAPQGASPKSGAVDVAAARKRLDAIRRGLERVASNRDRAAQRTRLAVDGRDVMAILGCPPGRRVGAAIRFLGDRVREDPSLNDPDRLRDELLAWSTREPAQGER